MIDNERNKEYQAPSVNRWGTVLDLTAGADKGGSGDPYLAGDPHSVTLPPQASGGGGGG